jgi:DNA-binding transcriptional regulator YiaG
LKKLIISIGEFTCHNGMYSEKDNDEIFDKIIGLQIRKIRLMRKISQMRLANILNVSFQQVQKYEKGKNACFHIRILKKICRVP